MIINNYLFLGLFYLLSISIIFAEETRVLWDFGVIIKTSEQQIIPEKSIESLSNIEIEAPHQVNALIADPFIPPTRSNLDEKVYDASIYLESLGEISPDNIHQIKLFAGRLTMQNNFQPIIYMISKIDFSELDEKDCLDLFYRLVRILLN